MSGCTPDRVAARAVDPGAKPKAQAWSRAGIVPVRTARYLLRGLANALDPRPEQPAPAPCPRGCDHSDAEHRAFDRGVRDGEFQPERENPYRRANLVEAWDTGHAVGTSNREAARSS